MQTILQYKVEFSLIMENYIKKILIMKTIEERSIEWAESNYFPDGQTERQQESTINAYAKIYSKIASVQREIDINKACEWLKARDVLSDYSLEIFRKAMMVE